MDKKIQEASVYEDGFIIIYDSKIKFDGETIYLKNLIDSKIGFKRKGMIVVYIFLGITGVLAILSIIFNPLLVYAASIPFYIAIHFFIWYTGKFYILQLVTKNGIINTVNSKDNEYLKMLNSFIQKENNVSNAPNTTTIPFSLEASEYIFLSFFTAFALYALYDIFIA